MTLPTYTRAQQLPAILEQRIAILDGAMGTMIQRFKLTEAQYRGERFADFAYDESVEVESVPNPSEFQEQKDLLG